ATPGVGSSAAAAACESSCPSDEWITGAAATASAAQTGSLATVDRSAASSAEGTGESTCPGTAPQTGIPPVAGAYSPSAAVPSGSAGGAVIYQCNIPERHDRARFHIQRASKTGAASSAAGAAANTRLAILTLRRAVLDRQTINVHDTEGD